MKKFTLLLAALVLMSTGVFALEVTPTITFAGRADVTFGVDLDTGATGIENATQTSLTLRFVPNNSDQSKTDDAEVTGYITLRINANINKGSGADDALENRTVATVKVRAAEIKFGDVVALKVLGYDKVVNAASIHMGQMPGFRVLETGAGTTLDPFVAFRASDVSEGVGEEHKGYGFFFDLDVVELRLGLSSADTWVGGANADNYYNFFAGVALTAIDDLTLDVVFNYEMADSSWGLGVKAGYDLGILPILVGFDIDNASKWEIGAFVGLKLGSRVARPFGIDSDDPGYIEGLNLGFRYGSDESVDLIAAFFDGDLIPVLDLVGLFELVNLEDIGIGVDARADLGVVEPYATARLNLATERTRVTAGVNIKVIPLTTFTLEYALDTTTTDAGTIIFRTRVAF